MAKHIDTDEAEWAATLADPERLRKFRPFVNAPTTADPTVARVEERGQLRPATRDEISRGEAVFLGATIPVREGAR